MTTQPYPEQFDCVWLASDSEGNLGAFITAGDGPIPTEALNSTAILFDDIEFRLLQLPLVSHVQLPDSVPSHDNFNGFAKRGLFVYDWSNIHRAYKLCAFAKKPISISSLPSDLENLASKVKLNKINFSSSQSIDVLRHMICSETALGHLYGF